MAPPDELEQQQPAAAVQVYLRIRPLIPEEAGDAVITYQADAHAFRLKLPDRGSRPSRNGAFAQAPPFRHRQERFEAYGDFTGILREECCNERAYQTAVRPLLEPIATNHESACVFTYGHTASGKTHTLLGYGSELGLYKFAAADLLERIQAQDSTKCLLLTVTELYGDRVLDLLTRQACTVRQDAKGHVRVRGPMVHDDQGRIEQQLLGALCRTPQEVAERVEAACENRRTGTSTHHSQSSRSHLVLTLEVVTLRLMDQRKLLVEQDAQLTRLKWLQTERTLYKHKEKPPPEWTKAWTSPSGLRKEIQRCEAIVAASRKELSHISQNLGGTLVFCDLAGNEYARDASGSTKEEREEAADINRSLLAVKEMIRALGRRRQNGRRHVSYRDSRLTMCLKRHLETRAVMLAHISPSAQSLKKTINTLNYSVAAGKHGKGDASH